VPWDDDEERVGNSLRSFTTQHHRTPFSTSLLGICTNIARHYHSTAMFRIRWKEDMDLTELLIYLDPVASYGLNIAWDFLFRLFSNLVSLQNLLSTAFIRNLFAKGMDWGIIMEGMA
jgi:hypothetical protein